jgi:hypothetical protein
MSITNGYCTLEELRGAIEKNKDTSDATLEMVIEAASRAIDNFCRRKEGFIALATATPRTYAGSGNAVQRIDECTSVTLVAVKDSTTDTTYTAWGAGDWLAGSGDPVHSPDFNRTPYQWIMVDPTGSYDYFTGGRYAWRQGFRPEPLQYSRGVPTVQITACWGYATAVPTEVKLACIQQSARWFKRLQSAMADTVGGGDMGVMMYRKSLDPDIGLVLKDGRFIRPAVA